MPEVLDCTSADDVDVPASAARAKTIREIVETYHALVWRSLRRLGIPAAHVDDATQHVFITAARRLSDLTPGKERAFVFGIAVKVAANERRKIQRARTEPLSERAIVASPLMGPEEALSNAQARQLLDEVLDGLADDLRTVFVLYELERMTAAEVAEYLAIPPGTVASRVKRARDEVQAAIQRIRAREGGLR